MRYRTGAIAKRLLFIPVAVFIVITLAFGLVNLTPGDPALVIAGDLAADEQVAEIRAELGTDKPVPQRYAAYIRELFTERSLGNSFFTKRPVWDEITQRFPDTLELVVLGLLGAVLYGSLLGTLSSYFRRRWPDSLSRVSVTITQSIPDFFMGLLLIYVIFYIIGWAPAPVGRIGLLDRPPDRVTGAVILDTLIARDWGLLKTAFHHAMLPVVTLALFYSSHFAKTTRAVLSRALNSDQVEFARACGLSELRVVGYAFREARTPVVTYIGILFAALFGGAAIVETVFAWGGLGQWAIDAMLKLDVPAIQGFILVVGLLTLLVYLLLDLIVVALDPRVSYE